MVCSIEIKALSSGPKWFLKPLNAKLNGHRDKFCYYCKQWAEIFSNSAFQKTFFFSKFCLQFETLLFNTHMYA